MTMRIWSAAWVFDFLASELLSAGPDSCRCLFCVGSIGYPGTTSSKAIDAHRGHVPLAVPGAWVSLRLLLAGQL